MLGNDVCINSATHVPARRDSGEARLDGSDDFVEYVVGDFFVECADVSEAPHEHFERFQLDARLVRDVLDREVREVRLARERTVAGELWNLNVDQIIPSCMRIGERVELGLRF